MIFAAALLAPELRLASASHGATAPSGFIDPSGAYIDGAPDPHRRVLAPGDFCGNCPDPAQRIFGVEYRRGDLWTIGFDGTLTHLSACQPIDVHSVQGFRGFATGLGYDSKRDQFIVADAENEEIQEVAPDGTLLETFPAPGTGSIGAAYDSTRDVYWITDFETDSLYALDPVSGASVHRFALPAGTRVSGAAYDPGLDAIYYNDRVQDPKSYFVSAKNGALLGSFPLPFTGFNGWEDNTLGPDGNLWMHNFENLRVYCVERSTIVPVHASTWGALKLRYR
jgi:DNA-binding beta-propeller fold protein YncE